MFLQSGISAEVAQTNKCEPEVSAQVHVQGDYGAKVDALLRRLLWLKEKEPDIKSLVS